MIAMRLPLIVAITLAAAAGGLTAATLPRGWSHEERALLRSLSLSSLEPLRPDPTNRYADQPAAAALGKALFFDTRLSSNGKVSCGTCHIAARDFQDGTPLASGVGTTSRRTMPIAGTAHGAWFFWDGRADSQWSQALGPLESPVEHGGSRRQYATILMTHYREKFEAVFGPTPEHDVSRVYANMGKAIAAYERRIEPGPSRFDRYVEAELAGRPHDAASSLAPNEEAGLRLFIGKASCANCHNGALLTDDHFHNTGVPASRAVAQADSGRASGVRTAVTGEFNCTSRYSDAKPDDCSELRFTVTEGDALLRAYKTPSLRNVAERAPYMHAGQIATLDDVVAHYDKAPRAPFGHTELKPLRLSRDEQRQIVAFLKTLTGPVQEKPLP